MTLSDKVALVTGAGTRLGRAIAVDLGRAGMNVGVHYLGSERGARDACSQIAASGSAAEPFRADLSDPSAARELVDAVVKRFGRLDLLVSSAANFERVEFAHVDESAWDRALDLNAKAGFVLAQQAAPHLTATRGSIVFITCSSTLTPMKNYLPYVVSKAAVLQLARVLALELAPYVRVNAVAPGTVLPPEDLPGPVLERLRRKIPLQRFGSSDEIVRAVRFLAESDFITGEQIAVDGGRSVAAVEWYAPSADDAGTE